MDGKSFCTVGNSLSSASLSRQRCAHHQLEIKTQILCITIFLIFLKTAHVVYRCSCITLVPCCIQFKSRLGGFWIVKLQVSVTLAFIFNHVSCWTSFFNLCLYTCNNLGGFLIDRRFSNLLTLSILWMNSRRQHHPFYTFYKVPQNVF